MATGGTEMTVAMLLARLRRARRKAQQRVKVTLFVFRNDGRVPVRIEMKS
jgi:hypothetical protein